MAQLNKDLSGYDIQVGFAVRPPGWYPAKIVDSKIGQSSKAPYIQFEFEIEDGKPGRVWEIMSLASTKTKNGSTVEAITMSKLKTLATCAGHRNPNFIADTEELHGLRCMVKLKIEKNDTYGDQNKISAYQALEKQTFKTTASTDPGPYNKPAAEKMPWE